MQIIIGSFKKTQIVKPSSVVSIGSAINLHKSNKVTVPFRAWPVDLDTYMHVNNASYLRVAELSRWRIFPQSGSLKQLYSKGWMFLAVEQTVSYFKPIPPMAKYIVSTSITATENKWLNYTHIFEQDPSTIKNGKEAIIYARIDLKAVVKEKSGKTVRALDFISTSDFYKELIHVAPVSVSSQTV